MRRAGTPGDAWQAASYYGLAAQTIPEASCNLPPNITAKPDLGKMQASE
jgi:hypothetical protein